MLGKAQAGLSLNRAGEHPNDKAEQARTGENSLYLYINTETHLFAFGVCTSLEDPGTGLTQDLPLLKLNPCGKGRTR